MNGFLFVDKPKGITSSSCVYKLRKVLRNKRIGHCGTLDPLATGVLPICIGEATKFSSFISDQKKEYEAKIIFGLETDSGDISGTIINRLEKEIKEQELIIIMNKYEGEQLQIPPMYSALKKNGKPLYRWVREGVFLKRAPRVVSIHSLKLLDFYKNRATVKVSCSKGTYIRTLVEDLGEFLGTKATVCELRRTKLGFVSVDQTIGLEEVNLNSLNEIICPYDQALLHLPKLTFNENETKKIRNGQPVDYNAHQEVKGTVRLYEDKASFFGVGEIGSSEKVFPKRLLSETVNSNCI